MNQISTEEEQEEFHEEQDSLWRLALSPTLWALHFVICYGATTVFCADHILGVDYLTTLRLGIGLLTIGVLAAIVWGRHHANIRRILKGEEPRIGKKS